MLSTIITFASLLIAVLAVAVAVPPMIVAARQLGWLPPTAPVRNVIEALPDSRDHVLITLQPENAKRPGTLEYDLANFESKVSGFYGTLDPLNGLILNPGLTRMRPRMVFVTSWIGIAMLALITATGLALLPSTGQIATVIGLDAIAIPTLLFLIFKARKVITVVDDYFAYLRANRIRIGVELTQAKAAHEAGTKRITAA